MSRDVGSIFDFLDNNEAPKDSKETARDRDERMTLEAMRATEEREEKARKAREMEIILKEEEERKKRELELREKRVRLANKTFSDNTKAKTPSNSTKKKVSFGNHREIRSFNKTQSYERITKKETQSINYVAEKEKEEYALPEYITLPKSEEHNTLHEAPARSHDFLDLSYWLNDDDLDVILAALKIKEKDESISLLNDKNICVTRACSAEGIKSIFDQANPKFKAFLKCREDPKSLLIPVIEGSHSYLIDIIFDSDNNVEIKFFDPHGCSSHDYFPKELEISLLEALCEIGANEIGNSTNIYPRQQKNEGQCCDFVAQYIYSRFNDIPYIFDEEASEAKDEWMRYNNFRIVQDSDLPDRYKKSFLLSTQKMSYINEADKIDAFELKIQKIYDSALISGSYGKALLFAAFKAICARCRNYEELRAFNIGPGSALRNSEIDVMALGLLREGDAPDGRIGGMPPLVEMFLDEGSEDKEAAYKKLQAYFLRERSIPGFDVREPQLKKAAIDRSADHRLPSG